MKPQLSLKKRERLTHFVCCSRWCFIKQNAPSVPADARSAKQSAFEIGNTGTQLDGSLEQGDKITIS